MVEPAEISVADDEAVVAVVECEALASGLDRLGERAANGRRLVAREGQLLDHVRELLLAAADVGNIGEGRDDAALRRAGVVDAQPGVAPNELLARLAGMAAQVTELPHPRVKVAARLGIHP